MVASPVGKRYSAMDCDSMTPGRRVIRRELFRRLGRLSHGIAFLPEPPPEGSCHADTRFRKGLGLHRLLGLLAAQTAAALSTPATVIPRIVRILLDSGG